MISAEFPVMPLSISGKCPLIFLYGGGNGSLLVDGAQVRNIL